MENSKETKTILTPLAALHPNYVNLLRVGKRAVFVQDSDTNSFTANIKLENQSCRFVSYVVRSSRATKFKIKPKCGFVQPQKSLEVKIETRDVKEFNEISKDCFGIFAVPIYDKRQLEKKKLDLLWRAHGTDVFPFESTEFHKIPYVLPASDNYLDHLAIAGRITEMSYITRLFSCGPSSMERDETPVDEEEFHMNWPNEGPVCEDPTLNDILSDWNSLSKSVHAQTKSIVDSFKAIVATLITVGSTMMVMSYLYWSDAAPFSSDRNIPVPTTPASEETWLSAILDFVDRDWTLLAW